MMDQHILRQGHGSLAELPMLMEELHISRPMIIGGGRARLLTVLLPAAPVFSAYHANPEWADAIAGYEMMKAYGCNGLIAIGGGSAIDTAKAVKAIWLAHGDTDAALRSEFIPGPLPVIAIPTTAGTGAEVTPAAVLYVGKKKVNPGKACLLPEAVILDSTLLEGLPLAEKLAGACDALAQGIESWWSVSSNPVSRVHAEKAVRGVWENLPAYITGGADAVEQLQLAAYESGLAIGITRTTAAHAMSYGITKNLGIRHGQACMLTLPVLWRSMLAENTMRPVLEQIAACLGTDAEAAPLLLLGMTETYGLRPAAAPDQALLAEMAAAVDPNRLGNHPQKLTTAQLASIYREALTPLDPEKRAAALQAWRDHD